MASFSELFGDKLLKQDTEVDTTEVLGKATAVGIYFSAHWCPPCRGFTPELAKCYKNAYEAKGLQIVFVSSDKTEEAFKEYYGEMPWLALPYSARDLKTKLSKKFKVQGIPTFVVLDGATGETITTDGRESVSEDPEGNNFPWKPPTFWEALGSDFLKTAGSTETVDVEEVRSSNKVIGLYFSAHWCPPCRGFTPQLVKAYTEHLKAKGLEIIFVSSDRSEKDFKEYFGEMPWLAIPHGDARKGKLSKVFGVGGIPSFALVDAKTGVTINANARGKIASDPTGVEFPYHPKPLNDMVAEGPGDINETPTLCVMMEGCDAPTREAAIKALEPIAAEFKEKGEEIAFIYAGQVGGPTEQIRKLTKIGEPTTAPQIVLMDIPDEGGFYVSPATEVTDSTVRAFLEAYKASGLDRQQLG